MKIPKPELPRLGTSSTKTARTLDSTCLFTNQWPYFAWRPRRWSFCRHKARSSCRPASEKQLSILTMNWVGEPKVQNPPLWHEPWNTAWLVTGPENPAHYIYIYKTTNERQLRLSKDWKWLASASGRGAAIYNYRKGVKSHIKGTETPQHLKLCIDGKHKMASKACCCQTSNSLFAVHLKISCPWLHVVPHWWVPKLPSYGQKEFETLVFKDFWKLLCF